MNDPIRKLFDPEGGALTSEEEAALCQTLARIQCEVDQDERSPRLENLIKQADPLHGSSVNTSEP